MGDDIPPGGGIPPDKAESTPTELKNTIGHRRRRQPATPTPTSIDTKATEPEPVNTTETPRSSEKKSPACTAAGCTKEADTQMINCTKCERNTHFRCTRLPGYQLGMFMTKGYRKFLCAPCCGEVHSDYLENDSPQTPNPIATGKSWEKLREEHILAETEVGRLDNIDIL